MSKNLLIVESPAKAHTIEKYLGKDFHVLASVGHIRKDTAVDRKTFDVTYEIDPDHKKVISELKKAAKEADTIWLATDEDREGEAISWHLTEVLKLPKSTNRITFHEITKPALEAAIKSPRTVDMDMVASQQARQTLDMLVGFDLSRVVWTKVPGAKSAGRVQSPALRLVVEREQEIEKFAGSAKFKVTGEFYPEASPKSLLSATLNKTFNNETLARNFLESMAEAKFTVSDLTTTPGSRKPGAPFTTASMQIEANSRLGFSTRTTMNAAQALYQAGLITYHRTDSLNLSKQAIAMTASYIEEHFGKNYLKVRNFKTKNAGAQEAHEAIRPTNIATEKAGKNTYEQKLYTLIRNRTLATQMADAITEKTTVKIAISESDAIFEAKGEVIIFDGFLKVAGRVKEEELPALTAGDILNANSISAKQNFSKPPARYTEGSLVKKLEELGIGRPSTYASIMQAIQTRGYVVKGESEGEPREVVQLTWAKGAAKKSAEEDDKIKTTEVIRLTDSELRREIITEKTGSTKGKLLPTPTGELLAQFLVDHFEDIVSYEFTANIEEDLDKIAEHKLDRVKMLRDFYGPFEKDVEASGAAPRYNNARELGVDPKTKLPVFVKTGKNGGFIQLGDNGGKRTKKAEDKPRFAPLPAGVNEKNITLEMALKQLELPSLPRTLGTAQDGAEIVAASGPFGPYLKAGKYNIPIKDYDPYKITFEAANELYQAKLDSIYADWGEIMIINGAYGPYVKGPGRFNNVKIPKDVDPKKITLEQATKMLEEKPTRRGRIAKKAATKRKTTKKSTKISKK